MSTIYDFIDISLQQVDAVNRSDEPSPGVNAARS
jgi:hypothetical protein